ncbi:MAG: FHA domain-containing protein [Clostridia bacterium]|nr:FHA domain-containing protein [Clostridia bacterium]
MQMTHLCFVSAQGVHTVLTEPWQEYPFPFMLWQRFRTEGNQIVLPEGWLAEGADGQPGSLIGLEDANYRLKGEAWTGMMLVRRYDENAMALTDCLTRDRFTVGRSRKNDICYRDAFLSSAHGVFSYNRQGQLCYEDDSTNGTFLNGTLLHHEVRVLREGDQLDFPPLMRVVVSNNRLFIRHPKEQAEVHLPLCPPPDGRKLVSLYFGSRNSICHVFVDPAATRSSFLSAARQQLPEDAAALLGENAVLQDVYSQTLVHSDALMAQHLQQASPCFFVL